MLWATWRSVLSALLMLGCVGAASLWFANPWIALAVLVPLGVIVYSTSRLVLLTEQERRFIVQETSLAKHLSRFGLMRAS